MFAFSYAPQIWPCLVAAVVVVVLAAYTRPRLSVRGARCFLIAQCLLLLVLLLEALVSVVEDLSAQVALFQFWAVTSAWVGLVALRFATDYAGLTWRVSRAGWTAIAAPLVVFSWFVLTNSAHGWVWSRFWYDGTLRSTLGFVGEVGSLYVCALVSVGLAILIMRWWRARGVLRWQATLLIAGFVVTALGFAAEVFAILLSIAPALSPGLYVAGTALTAAALFRFPAFDLAPIARHAVVERMSHGMMVLDEKHRIIDLNPVAQRLVHAGGWGVIGQDARKVLEPWPELRQMVVDGNGADTEVRISDGKDRRLYDVSVSPLLDLGGDRMGNLVLWLDVTDAEAARAEVGRQRAALAALTERERLGRELHDGLAQALGAIKLQAQAARDALGRNCLTETDDDLQQILAVSQDAHEGVRDFLLGARSIVGPSTSFLGAVVEYVERYSLMHGLQVDVTPLQSDGDLDLDLETQVQLLRVIQECLTNVRRHAGVSMASLAFATEDGHLRITVRDDGKGFSPQAVPGCDDGHFGLSFMQERAAEIGGHLEVTSAPGQGTLVCVDVPLTVKDAHHATAACR